MSREGRYHGGIGNVTYKFRVNKHDDVYPDDVQQRDVPVLQDG